MELGSQTLYEQFEEVISRDNKLEIHEFMNSQNISDVADLINDYEEFSIQIITSLSTNRAASRARKGITVVPVQFRAAGRPNLGQIGNRSRN